MTDESVDGIVLSTYKEVVEYLMNRSGCDKSCLFHNDCPVYLDASLKDTCLIKRDKTFDVFFNIFLDTKRGIDNEIKTALYKMSRDAITSGDSKEYLNNLIKVKAAFYGPDKNKEVDEITQVNIDIAPVPEEVLRTAQGVAHDVKIKPIEGLEHAESAIHVKSNTKSKKRNTPKKEVSE